MLSIIILSVTFSSVIMLYVAVLIVIMPSAVAPNNTNMMVFFKYYTF
jgi:hypothetical protein